MLENITYKKVKKYNVIIIVKKFHDKTIGSDIKNMKNQKVNNRAS